MLEDAIKELEAVAKTIAPGDDKPADQSADMDEEAFVRHMTKNIAALKEDTAETAAARVTYLGECLTIAKASIAKNFEGSVRSMSIPNFKDPAQHKTTESSGALPKGAKPGSSQTTHGTDQQPTSRNVSPTSTTSVAPPSAGPSGAPFAAPGGNFAKSLDEVMKGLQEVIASLTATPEPTAPKPVETVKTESEADKTKREKREKATAPVSFPADMAAESAEIDESTHFGFDKGSPLEKRYQADKAKAAATPAE